MTSLAAIDEALSHALPTLVLGESLFEMGTTLSTSIAQSFSDSDMQIVVTGVTANNYRFDAVHDTITFSGVGHGGPFDGMTVSPVTIEIVSGEPQLVVVGRGPEGWHVSDGFPDIKAPVLRELALHKPDLTWSSYEDDANDLAEGFYLVATVDFDEPPLSLLASLVPGLKAPELWGSITMQGSTAGDIVQYVPNMMLEIDDSAQTAQLGPFELHGPQFRAFASPYFDTSTNTWQVDSRVCINAAVQFKSDVFRIEVDVNDARSDILLEADLGQPIAAALDDLVDFVGGTALQIPGFELELPEALVFKDLKVRVDPAGGQKIKLVRVEIDTAAAERWRLWDDVFLEDISIVFDLTPGSTGYVVDGEISGVVSDWLTLRAGFASDGHYTFYGGLAKTMTIKEVCAFFTQSVPDDVPDLTIESFHFTLDRTSVGAVSYSGEVTADGTWPVVTDPVEIDLDGVLFRITHDASKTDTRIEASGVLEISDYSVGVNADHDTTDGWRFEGTAAVSDPKPSLTTAAAKFDAGFPLSQHHAARIPAFLSGWAVERLDAKFASLRRTFDFTLAVSDSAVPDLVLDFEIHLEQDGAAFSRQFGGTALISDARFDLSLALVFDEQRGTQSSTTSTITGRYSSDRPPRLSDLLLWMASTADQRAALPGELDIDAEPEALVVRIEQTDQTPPTVEAAGEFSVQASGSDWHVFLAWTNAASFSPSGPRALVAGAPAYALGVALSGVVDLSRLPLVGRIPGVDKLRVDKLGFFGEFNRSSQHLDQRSCDGQASWLDDGTHGPLGDEVAGQAVASARCRAVVLA